MSRLNLVVISIGLTVMASGPALAMDGVTLRGEVANQTIVCANDQFTISLAFDATASSVKRRFNGQAPETVKVAWLGTYADIPLDDLAEPGRFERRGKHYRYDGLPCRLR